MKYFLFMVITSKSHSFNIHPLFIERQSILKWCLTAEIKMDKFQNKNEKVNCKYSRYENKNAVKRLIESVYYRKVISIKILSLLFMCDCSIFS